MVDDIVIGMAGSGGDGIVSAGESLTNAATQEGFYALMTKSFGSQIRGGESSCRVRLSTRPILNRGGVLDVAVALNWEDFLRFGSELQVGGQTVVIYEAKTGVAPEEIPIGGVRPAEVFAVPITDLAKQAAGSDKAKNSVVLGLISGWFDFPQGAILRGIEKRFAKKGAELIEANRKALELGANYAQQHPLRTPRFLQKPEAGAKVRMLADGNSLCGAAAIFSGCTFFGGYPITPSSEVMEFMTREIWKYGGSVLQAEDEIAGIGTAVGASYAGKKSMTCTSGPGMSLKTEILGLASIAELPLVVVNVQRGGPSTGLPTKAEQSDLFQACFSAHGDVLRPVLAPTTVADTFDITVEAFNLAEEFQTPVILLSDQEIGQRKETIDPIDTSRFRIVERRRPEGAELDHYSRFRLTESGVSPLSHPGLAGGNYQGAGIEHNESGNPTSSGSMHEKMNAKRFHKLDPLHQRRDLFATYGDAGAPLALVSWGSTAGVAMEALNRARAAGVSARLLVPRLLYPVAADIYAEFFAGVRLGLVVEQSYQAQLYRLLRMFVDVPKGMRPMARSGANPFDPQEIADALAALAMELQRAGSESAQPIE